MKVTGQQNSYLKLLKRLFIKKKKKIVNNENIVYSLKIDSYLNNSGEFEYSKYKKIQTEGNKAKLEKIWVKEDNIMFLSNYIKFNVPEPKFGICHGTRRGMEQAWFRKYLGIDVIGTEISDTALSFPNTINWDFHDIKDEWISNVDFIYSNSFDHSYDPQKCLNSWLKCLKPDGICIIEHSDFHGIKGVTNLDPFGADLIIMPYLILNWSEGNFYVAEIIKAPEKDEYLNQLSFLIIKHNR